MGGEREIEELTQRVKRLTLDSLLFDAVGIASCERVPDELWSRYEASVHSDSYAGLDYLKNYPELRRDPRLLLPTGRSIIVVAQSYYPPVTQPSDAPQIAYYAYGRDYHKVMRGKLARLLTQIQTEIDSTVEGLVCCDSAPVIERYWVEQAGVGVRGRSGLMIIPKRGTFFIFGVLIVSMQLQPDAPLDIDPCGNCHRCIDHCPGGALQSDGGLFRATSCISYLTIEHSGPWPEGAERKVGNRLFGCDHCQLVCPHNSHARPHREPDFALRPAIAQLTYDRLAHFSPELYDSLTIGSSMRRCKYPDLLRNAQAVLSNRTQSE